MDGVESNNDKYRKKAKTDLENRVKKVSEILIGGSTQADRGRRAAAVHAGHRSRMRSAANRDRDLRGFSDIELIEFLLSFLIPQKDTNVAAHRLIDKFGSVSGVLRAPEEALAEIPGITKHAAALLPEILHMCIDSGCAEIRIIDRKAAAEFFMAMYLGTESYGIYVAYLDKEFKLIVAEKLTEKQLTPRVVVTTALTVYAKYVFIARRDNAMFPDSFGISEFVAKLNTGLFAIGVKLLDYMMFTNYGYYTVGKPPKSSEWTPVYMFVPVQGFSTTPELLKSIAGVGPDADVGYEKSFFEQLKTVAEKRKI